MIDLFAAQFSFKIDNQGNDKKKTVLGQLLTLIIIILSLGYLFYLLYFYFQRLVPPTISSETELPEGKFTYDFSYSPMHIQVYTKDEEIRKNIDKYYSLWVLLRQGEAEDDITMMQKCIHIYPEETEKYHENDFCLQKEKAKLQVNRKNHEDFENIYVIMARCDSELDSQGKATVNSQNRECKSLLEIDELQKKPDFVVLLNNIFFELNLDTGNLEEVDEERQIYLDPDIIQHSITSIKVAETDTDRHVLWTHIEKKTFAYDFQETKYFYDKTFVEKKFDSEIFKHAVMINQFTLHPSLKKNLVVFQKFSEMLAQFLSIFNTLLILGILGSLSSESKLIEILMDSYLKNYYKGTGLQLYQQSQMEKNPENKISLADSESDNLIPQEAELMTYNPFKSLYLQYKAPTRDKKMHNNSVEPNKVEKDQVYIRMVNQVMEAQQFTKLFKDILELKTQMQLIMNEQQYASSKYISRKLFFTNSEDGRNHLEKSDLIDQNQNIRDQQLSQFLIQAQKSDNQLDRNIYDSLPQHIKDKGNKNFQEIKQELMEICRQSYEPHKVEVITDDKQSQNNSQEDQQNFPGKDQFLTSNLQKQNY